MLRGKWNPLAGLVLSQIDVKKQKQRQNRTSVTIQTRPSLNPFVTDSLSEAAQYSDQLRGQERAYSNICLEENNKRKLFLNTRTMKKKTVDMFNPA